jgi:DNA-binding CsgD family transcriptional regulator
VKQHVGPQAYLSHTEALELLELIHASVSCTTHEAFWGLFSRLQNLIPFAHAVAVLGNLDSDGDAKIVQAVNVSYPDEWVRLYMEKNFAPMDAVVQEHFSSFKPFCWKEIYSQRKQSDTILSITRDMCISDGYSHGVQSAIGARAGSLFSFSNDKMPNEERINCILEYVVPHLHQAFMRVVNVSGSTHTAVVLSPREKEVLEWLKCGKSSWDISVILGVSERTVNFHVYNMMNKLGATNRTQIVSIAVHLGLIRLD